MISAPTLDSIYRVPLAFDREHFGEKITAKLGLGTQKPEMKKWEKLMDNIDTSLDVLNIGMVGKNVDLEDAYYSLNE